jgi:hypothetical protein
MIATSHVIIGGAVGLATGAVTQNPILAGFAGVVSHLLCDMLPHWDHPEAPRNGDELVWTKKVYIFAITDSSLGAILTFGIWGILFDFSFTSLFVWGAGGGYLPDFLDNVPLWKDKIRQIQIFRRFHALHMWVHHLWMPRFPMPQNWVLGSATQLMIGLPSLWYVLSHAA